MRRVRPDEKVERLGTNHRSCRPAGGDPAQAPLAGASSEAMHMEQAALVVTKRCQAGPGPSVP